MSPCPTEVSWSPPPPLFLVPTPPPALAPLVGVDSGGVGAGGTSAGGAGFGGAGAGVAGFGGASFGGAGSGGAGIGGASSGCVGAGGISTVGARPGGVGAGGTSYGGAGYGGVGAGCAVSTLEEEEEQQQQALSQPLLPQLFPPVSGLRTLGLPSSPLDHSLPPLAHGPTFPPPDSSPAIFSPSQPQPPPPVVQHTSTTHCPPSARATYPVQDLPSSHPIIDYYCTARPIVSHVLASLVTNTTAPPSFALALVAAVTDFASTRRLDYATRVVAAHPTRPLSVEGESALGSDVLEDRQFELAFLAAASLHLCAMLLAHEGDPDAPDIPTLRTYAEAVLGPWASQWIAAIDSEMASWRSTGTYVDAVPPPTANVVNGMWIVKVKRPLGLPPIFKARYEATCFGPREGVDFCHTFSPTPKMTTLRVSLRVAAQQNYELHSVYFSTAFLQGSLHKEIWQRHPPGFTGTFPPRTQWSLRRPVYRLRQAPHEWHDTLCTTLAYLVLRPWSADITVRAFWSHSSSMSTTVFLSQQTGLFWLQ
ncbi:unnamed protein product [Closterium sp. NIES-54]